MKRKYTKKSRKHFRKKSRKYFRKKSRKIKGGNKDHGRSRTGGVELEEEEEEETWEAKVAATKLRIKHEHEAKAADMAEAQANVDAVVLRHKFRFSHVIIAECPRLPMWWSDYHQMQGMYLENRGLNPSSALGISLGWGAPPVPGNIIVTGVKRGSKFERAGVKVGSKLLSVTTVRDVDATNVEEWNMTYYNSKPVDAYNTIYDGRFNNKEFGMPRPKLIFSVPGPPPPPKTFFEKLKL